MKKYRLKKKPVAILVFIILVIIVEIVNPFEKISRSDLKKLKYQDETIDFILDNGLKKETLDHEYSEFVDKTILSKDFKKEYYSTYLDLDYYEKSDDLNNVNQLIEKEYSTDDINLILRSGNNKSISEFVKKEKYDKLSDYLKYDYAKLSLIDRYIEYKASNVCTYKDAIVYVNIGLDNEFYEQYNDVTDFSFTMIVNKYNKLSEEFVPKDLISFPQELLQGNDKEEGNKVMVEAFSEMAKKLNLETGKKIYANNAYRSYKDQESVYNKYLKQYGEKYVKNNVSMPGFSEHQTGLTVDVVTNNDFKNSIEREWLKNNSYKYGFIMRYPENKSEITGYQGVIRQYRYVGVEVATYIEKNKITFEEYYAMFLDKE